MKKIAYYFIILISLVAVFTTYAASNGNGGGDGTITVTVSGVDATKVICKAGGGTVVATYDGLKWTANMGPTPNGPVVVRVVGKSTSANMSVTMTHVTVASGICRNKSDRARVQGTTGLADCACTGLDSSTGDKVVIRVKGTYTGGGGGGGVAF